MRPVVKLKVKGPAFPSGLGTAMKLLEKKQVLVGVPSSSTVRDRDAVPKMNNATLAFIHDNGSPLAGIPPRPFMRPGIDSAKKEITEFLVQAGQAAMKGEPAKVDRALQAAGLTAQKAIRRKIQTGPFTPLKAATIRARKSRHKSRSNTKVTPLIDTGQLINSINYVVRNKER